MKKITIIEIITIILVIIAFAIYFSPNFISKKEDRILSQVKAKNAIFVSKIVEEFAHNKNAKPSEVAKKIVEQLNKTETNPYNKKDVFYVLKSEQKGYANVEYDDGVKMVVITTLDKKGELVARTVISPPSFVTYYKED